MTDRPSWRLAPGDPVAGRRLVRHLGGGKRTEVVLARGDDDVLVVVKLLRPGAGPAATRAVVAEAELLAGLDHPAFPRLVELRGTGDGPLALVLEHVPGPRLSTAVRREGPLAPVAAARLAAHLADGLAALAAAGSVHLDVKPSNTILAPDRPRLVDLGIARSIADARAVRGTVGSHRFQSPEQHDPEGFGGLGPPADVWGIGVTVATALRGRSPFGPLRDELDERRGLTPADVAGVRLPDDVPSELARLVRDAMAWAPGDRPTAREVAVRGRELVRRLASG